MLYCYHCGKEIDEHKVEAKSSSLDKNASLIDENAKVNYVCPRCGHLIHPGMDEQDVKSLSSASHAEIQRGRNFFARGMSFLCVGAIALIVSYVFFLLAHKANSQNQLVMDSPEFFVFMVLVILGGISFLFGLSMAVYGEVKKRHYQSLLRRIQNQTFVQ